MYLRLLTLIALLLAATALSSAPLPSPGDRVKADLKAMQGEWTVVEYKINKGVHVRREIPEVNLVVEGNVLVINHFSTRNIRKEFRLPASGQIDTGPAAGDPSRARDLSPWNGVYRLEGDTLMICEGPGKERPEGFSAAGPGERLLVFKRVKPRP